MAADSVFSLKGELLKASAFKNKMSLTGPVPVSKELRLSLKDPRTGLGKVVIFKCDCLGKVLISQTE